MSSIWTATPNNLPIEHITLEPLEQEQLGRICLYHKPLPKLELAQLTWTFPAGRWFESKKVAAVFCAELLKAGTQELNGRELAKRIEYYGAELKCEASMDEIVITLMCLDRFIDELVPLVQSMLKGPVFPEKEVRQLAKRRQQRLKINAKKTDYHAARLFYGSLFGYDHPYGYSPQKEDYQSLTSEDLLEHFRAHVAQKPCRLYYCGNRVDTLKSMLVREGQANAIEVSHEPFPVLATGLQHHNMPKAVQSSIRFGKRKSDKTHQDYIPHLVVNTLFGGYFGSRLMTNIRQEKGLTYGIYSYFTQYQHAAYFGISADVAKENMPIVLEEIDRERERLMNDSCSQAELDMTKTYLLGSMMRMVDGPLRQTTYLRDLHRFGLDAAFFHQVVEGIKAMDIQVFQAGAQDLLGRGPFLRVAAG